ncbi:MAG: PAS domain S-box protein [Planctomycetota bacterium]|nr:PAS domain S-box protein [Planctomycetota bacterium]
MSMDAQSHREKPTLWAGISGLLLDRTIVLIGLVLIIIMVLLIWHRAQVGHRLVESTAQEEARRYTEALATFRTLYTREVVEPLRSQNIVVTHDYELDKYEGKAIPLPATLSMLIGNELAKRGSNGQTALYSGYPFPWREEEWNQRDQFAKDAWQALTNNPAEPYQRFEDRDGRRWLRYATADLMRKSCIECHNNHPQSPKNDWQEGDVRGVLEVSLPLDRAVAQTKSNLRTSIGTTVAVGTLGFVALVIAIGRLRRASRESELSAAESRRTEQRFRATIECAPTAILMIDRDGKIVLVNPAAEHLFGYGEQELIGQLVEILVPHSLREQCPQLRDGFFADPEPRQLGRGRELFGERQDGSQFPVEIGVCPVDTAEGLCVLANIVDLTDQRRLAALQQQLLDQSQAELDFAHCAARALLDDQTETSAIVRQTGDELLGIESFDHAMNMWARQARDIVGAHQSAVSYIPRGDFAEGKHAISMSEKYDQYKTYDVLPSGEGIWALVAKEKLSFCLTDEELQSHPGWKNFSDKRDERGLEHPPMRGWLAVPVLSHKHEFVGVLQLTDKYKATSPRMICSG